MTEDVVSNREMILDGAHQDGLFGFELQEIEDPVERSGIEQEAADWLYDLVRRNIKRGRVFQLSEVLRGGYADCVGYARLFHILGLRFGLDTGIVEVVIDNGGRYLPHCVNLFTPSVGRTRFIDLWYGSKDISHRRIGAQIKERGRWRIRDLDRDELDGIEGIRGLPEASVDAIVYYILGNRHLEEGVGGVDRAIECYNEAIRLSPLNARAHFNRAIAYEIMGDEVRAEMDYARALGDEAGLIRVLAREYDEIVQLIELDAMEIPPQMQEIYLLRKGFITGTEEAPVDIARECRIPQSEVERILSETEALIGP